MGRSWRIAVGDLPIDRMKREVSVRFKVVARRIDQTSILGDPVASPNLDPHEEALYDDLRNDRLGDRVRLEQERVKYQLVEEVVLALHH